MNNKSTLTISAEDLYNKLDNAFKTDAEKAYEILRKIEIKTDWSNFFRMVHEHGV